MIPRECRRLAEVDFPIAAVSRHAAREKSIRHGHPSTLHLWWARRPLASSRAVLLALLLPDPADPACPAAFRRAAERQIRELAEHLVTTKSGSALLSADLKSDLGSPKPDRKLKAEREADRRAKLWRGIAETRRWTPPKVVRNPGGGGGCRVLGVRASVRPGRTGRHGGAGEGDLPLLRRRSAAGAGA